MKLTNHPADGPGVYYLSYPFIFFLDINTSTLTLTQPVILDNLTWHEMMMQLTLILITSNNLEKKILRSRTVSGSGSPY